MNENKQEAAIRVLMMPRETNAHGTIFGGIILSYIDQAGAVGARRMGCRQVVTVAMDQVEFHQPVYVGNLVSFYSEVEKIGRTSITVMVTVEAEDRDGREPLVVTQARVTYVHVDEQGRPIAIPKSERA